MRVLRQDPRGSLAHGTPLSRIVHIVSHTRYPLKGGVYNKLMLAGGLGQLSNGFSLSEVAFRSARRYHCATSSPVKGYWPVVESLQRPDSSHLPEKKLGKEILDLVLTGDIARDGGL